MANPVVNGAFIQCSFASSQPPGVPMPGPFPATATALPPSAVPNSISILPTVTIKFGGQPVATSMDNKVGVNIKPFQMSCKSPANPANATASASATAAAMGTPMTVVTPCVPVFPGPWAPGCPTCLAGNFPLLNNTSKLMCSYGGVISIQMTPAILINVP